MIARRPARALLLVAVPTTLVAGAWLYPHLSSTGVPGRNAVPHPASSTASPTPVPAWTEPQLKSLIAVIGQADSEGLRASDYRIDELRAAAGGGQSSTRASALAETSALALAHDFAAGRVRNRHRFNWYIDHAGPSPAELAGSLLKARTEGRLEDWLRGLLPTSSAYHALRAALADTAPGDTGRRARIRANMERWRWLPRDFGKGDQLYVNLPSYRLDVVESGRTTASYRAVIGATDMPTPALSVPVTQVVANPDWIVPASIVRRSHLRPGASSRYTFSTRPDGTLRVRQKPGPGNALGRVKIVFPNPLAIYFHDTPSKSLFGASARAFSHGCVRVQDIATLAASLVASPERFDAALAGVDTRSFKPAHGWRADIVYLTMVPDAAGVLADVGDPYGLDAPLAAALDGIKSPIGNPAPAKTVAPRGPATGEAATVTRKPVPNSDPSPSPDVAQVDDGAGSGEDGATLAAGSPEIPRNAAPPLKSPEPATVTPTPSAR